MGGERASTARQRQQGVTCWNCGNNLEPPFPGRERACAACDRPRHRIYMHFQCRQGWHVSFLQPDLKTSLPRKLTFLNEDKIREMFDRSAESKAQDDRHNMEHGLADGRGGIWLLLNDAQLAALMKRQ